MNREFLESLGLEKELIEKIIAEHGKSTQKVKTELDEVKAEADKLKDQLTERDKDLEALEAAEHPDEALKTQLAELQTKYESEKAELESSLVAHRKASAIELGITQAGARNMKAVVALLDQDKITVSDNGIEGLKEQIEAIKKSDEYLFEPDFEPSGQAVAAGNPARPKETLDPAFEEAVKKFTR